jgi:hypothetical protein
VVVPEGNTSEQNPWPQTPDHPFHAKTKEEQ